MLEPILAPDLVEHVTARVREAILEGTLTPGDRLVEEQLASRLDVSRAPIREAMRILEHEGLVTSSTRRGRFVTQLSTRDAWEIYSLRESLEAMAFGLVTSNVPDGLVTSASEILDSMAKAVEATDRDALARLDFKFHRLIVEGANHKRLLRTWDSMSNQIALLARQVVVNLYVDVGVVPVRHRELLATIQAGDPAAAQAAIHDHIESVAEILVGSIEESEETPDTGKRSRE